MTEHGTPAAKIDFSSCEALTCVYEGVHCVCVWGFVQVSTGFSVVVCDYVSSYIPKVKALLLLWELREV